MRKLLCVILISAQVLIAQAAEDYSRSQQFSPDNLRSKLFSTQVKPHWSEDGTQFWYRWEDADGDKYWVLEQKNQWQKKPLLSTGRLVKEINRASSDEDFVSLVDINVKNVNFNLGLAEVLVGCPRASKVHANANCGQRLAVYDLQEETITSIVKAPAPVPEWASLSPDGMSVIYVKAHDLYCMSAQDMASLAKDSSAKVVERRLTKDGKQGFDYTGVYHPAAIRRSSQPDVLRQKPNVQWSPNSRYFSLVRYDNRKVKPLWVVDSLTEARPQLLSYAYAMPGDKDVPQASMYVFDLRKKRGKRISRRQYIDEYLIPISSVSLGEKQSIWQTDKRNNFYFYRVSRDMKKAQIVAYSVLDNAISVINQEQTDSYFIYHPYYNMIMDFPFYAFKQEDRQIFWSTASGWGALYLKSAGAEPTALTGSGTFVTGITAVDEERGIVYYTARGAEQGIDPHYEYLYSVQLDGGGRKRLNSLAENTRVDVSPGMNVFVNNVSSASSPPYSELVTVSGSFIRELERADLSKLDEIGFGWPKNFNVTASDGTTELYGIMYLPSDFDPKRKYPMLVNVYPGPQSQPVPKYFEDRDLGADFRFLAEQGYVVIAVENRAGSPDRGSKFQSLSMGNFRDYGLADIKAAVDQLVAEYGFIDKEKVGIYGGSGGGFMSTAAILTYPKVFKVAVSAFGNHTNDIYNQWWGEIHNGVYAPSDDDPSWHFNVQKNTELAANLTGKLLLVTGDVDTNVHPANTYRMVNALIKEGKRFDFFLMPGQGHGFKGRSADYFRILRADYFNRYLKGNYQSPPVTISELPPSASAH